MLSIWKLKSTAKDNMVSIKFIIVFQQTEFLLQLSNTLPSLSSCSTPCYGILQKLKVYVQTIMHRFVEEKATCSKADMDSRDP